MRITKIFLIAAVALWGLAGAMHNLLDWQGTLGAVKAAVSMSTFDGGSESWQATSNLLVIWLGALFIVMSKITSAALCLHGGATMWLARNAEAGRFNAAKQTALVGCGVAIFMLFTGFVVIAETWFELWRSDAMRGPVLDSALRYAVMISVIAILVAQEDR